RIDEMGGIIEAIERGFPQSEIARASYEYQTAVEQGKEIIVGVNRFVEKDERPPELLQIGASAEQHQLACLADVKSRRDASAVTGALAALREAAAGTANTMPHI